MLLSRRRDASAQQLRPRRNYFAASASRSNRALSARISCFARMSSAASGRASAAPSSTSRHRAAKRGNTKESGAETLPPSQAECGARRSFATRSLNISGNLRGSNASSAYKAESVQQLPDTPDR